MDLRLKWMEGSIDAVKMTQILDKRDKRRKHTHRRIELYNSTIESMKQIQDNIINIIPMDIEDYTKRVDESLHQFNIITDNHIKCRIHISHMYNLVE
jgi:hypothetical protein